MKKFAVLLALLTLMLCIVPCYAEDALTTVAPVAPVAPDTPVSSTPAEALPEQEDIPLIGEAFVGTDAPIAPSPDTPIEHPIAPDAGESYEGKDILLIAPAPGEEIVTDGALAVAPEAPAANVVVSTTVDEEGNILLTMADGSTMIAGKAEATQPESETETTGFMFEPANFVSNLYYMAVGMVGIFIVIGLIVLATILLNRFFRDKAQKSE
jgi:hypothetical protein